MRFRISNSFKRSLAMTLVLTLVFACIRNPILISAAEAVTKVTVTNQKELDSALNNGKVTHITIKTNKKLKLKISNKNYTIKKLIIKAPYSAITNEGTFKSVNVFAYTQKQLDNVLDNTSMKATHVTIASSKEKDFSIESDKDYSKVGLYVKAPKSNITSNTDFKFTNVYAYTQADLDKALANSKSLKATHITISSSDELSFLIPEGDYTNLNLIVNAPNSIVENNSVFKSVDVDSVGEIKVPDEEVVEKPEIPTGPVNPGGGTGPIYPPTTPDVTPTPVPPTPTPEPEVPEVTPIPEEPEVTPTPSEEEYNTIKEGYITDIYKLVDEFRPAVRPELLRGFDHVVRYTVDDIKYTTYSPQSLNAITVFYDWIKWNISNYELAAPSLEEIYNVDKDKFIADINKLVDEIRPNMRPELLDGFDKYVASRLTNFNDYCTYDTVHIGGMADIYRSILESINNYQLHQVPLEKWQVNGKWYYGMKEIPESINYIRADNGVVHVSSVTGSVITFDLYMNNATEINHILPDLDYTDANVTLVEGSDYNLLINEDNKAKLEFTTSFWNTYLKGKENDYKMGFIAFPYDENSLGFGLLFIVND